MDNAIKKEGFDLHHKVKIPLRIKARSLRGVAPVGDADHSKPTTRILKMQSKSEARELISWFLIALTLSIPTTHAELITIQSITATNKEGVVGYRALSGDKISYRVEVSAAINATQLRIGDSGIPFTRCHQGSTTSNYVCLFETDILSSLPQSRAYNVVIRLYRENLITLQAQRSILVTIDSIPPTVEITNIQQRGSNAIIDYTVSDTACTHPSCQGCSGIGTIEFFHQDNKIQELTPNTSSCSYQNTTTLPIVGDGTITFKIKATDRMKLIGETTSQLDVDTTPPQIGELRILDQNNEPLGFITSTLLHPANVEIDIIEKNLSFVRADLSGLNENPSYASMYRNRVLATCPRVNTTSRCVFPGIAIGLFQPTYNITVWAQDRLGNNATKTFAGSLQIDNDRPKVTFIGTDKTFDQVSYIKNGINNFVVNIEETGSGFENDYNYQGGTGKGVVINLVDIGGPPNVALSECSPSWICNGTIEIPSSKNGTIYLNPLLTRDDVGNTASGLTSGEVRVDNTPPKIHNIVILSDTTGSLVRQDDTVSVFANISDETPVTAILDISQVIGGDPNISTSCEGGICAWPSVGTASASSSLGSLGEQSLRNVPVKFTFVDLVGNMAKNTSKVDILIQENATPNYWTVLESGINLRPSSVDPTTTTLIPQVVWAQIPLQGRDDVEPLFQEVGCGGDGMEFMSGEPELRGGISKSPFLRFTLAQRSFKNERNIELECNMTIISKRFTRNRVFLSLPEVETFTITIPFSNLPLGQISPAVQAKIDSARNDKMVKLSEKLSGIEKILSYANAVCKINQLINSISSLWASVNVLISAFSGGLTSADLSVKRQQKAQDIYQIEIFKTFQKWCAALGCGPEGKLRLFGDWYDKFRQDFKWDVKPGGVRLGTAELPASTDNSLIFSVATMCIPGIIENLKKYKEIQCQYIDCLQNQVPQGLPIAVCSEQRRFQECMYTYGQIFELIPFTHFFRTFGAQLQAIFDNPVSMVFGGIDFACKQKYLDTAGQAQLCTLANNIPILSEAIEDLLNFKDRFKGFELIEKRNSACKRVGIK